MATLENLEPVNLAEFLQEKREELIEFEKLWNLRHRDSPDEYPMSLEIGEWDEQFLIMSGYGADGSDN